MWFWPFSCHWSNAAHAISVDKTHRNFAFGRPFSIYLTCFFSFIVTIIQTPFRIDRRKLRLTEESDELSEKKTTYLDESKAMRPLCLCCNTIVVTKINKQTKTNKTHTRTIHSHIHEHTHSNQAKEWRKNAGKPNNGKGIYFISSIWQ